MTDFAKWRILLPVLGLALSGCSSGSSGGDEPPPGVPANQPPTLSGTPASTVVQDQQYSFIPTAADADGDSLTFTISNLPAWMDFDEATGALTGTPGMAEIGSYPDIVIEVSDGQDSASLEPFEITVLASATGSLTLSWTPPSRDADGSPLQDLAGYRIHWGTQTGNYPNALQVNEPGIASFLIENLAPGNYFCAVSAFDAAGNESELSNEAMGTAQ